MYKLLLRYTPLKSVIVTLQSYLFDLSLVSYISVKLSALLQTFSEKLKNHTMSHDQCWIPWKAHNTHHP